MGDLPDADLSLDERERAIRARRQGCGCSHRWVGHGKNGCEVPDCMCPLNMAGQSPMVRTMYLRDTVTVIVWDPQVEDRKGVRHASHDIAS